MIEIEWQLYFWLFETPNIFEILEDQQTINRLTWTPNMGRWYFSGAEEREWLKVAGGSKARLLEASWASWKGLFLSNNSYTNTDWWFGTFLIFPYIGNNHPNWLSYFSEGLKPPTRILLIWYYYEFLVRVSVIRSIILNIIYIYGKCLGFARTHNDDGRRIIVIINIMIINIIIIIINIIKLLLTIFNECRSLTGVGELNPYWRSSMNVEV